MVTLWHVPYMACTIYSMLLLQGRQCFLYECADFVDTQQVTEEFTAMAEEKQLVALIVDRCVWLFVIL